MLYIENPIDFTKKLIGLINEFSKVAGYKNQYSEFNGIFTNNELSERDTKKTIPFTIATTTKNKVPRNRFNQGGKRPVFRKLQDF